jgi:hypothetical protein
MSEQAPRQPLTGGEREILFQIQQLQAKWIDTRTDVPPARGVPPSTYRGTV